MSELVERLKAYAKDQGGWHNIDDTCEEAAAEITRLTGELSASQARVKALEDALRPFAEAAAGLNDDTPEDAEVDYTDNLTVGDLRQAARAMEEK